MNYRYQQSLEVSRSVSALEKKKRHQFCNYFHYLLVFLIKRFLKPVSRNPVKPGENNRITLGKDLRLFYMHSISNFDILHFYQFCHKYVQKTVPNVSQSLKRYSDKDDEPSWWYTIRDIVYYQEYKTSSLTVSSCVE